MNDKICVLIVDDEKQFVLNLAKLLRFRGFDVSTAFDGYQAVDAVKSRGGFDVVVLDVKMPGMDGIATLGEIKKWAPDTEVIMLTGQATLSSGTQAMRKGAYDYLMKPCDIENLVEKIQEAYEVESIKRHPVLWRRSLVKEITWPSFKKLETTDLLVKALDIFKRATGKISKEELYVLDKNDRFQGVVTKRDLVNEAQNAHPENSITWSKLVNNPQLLPQKELSEVVHPEHPLSTNPEENLTDVAHQMIQNNIRCMPVVQEGKVIGIIRLQDIFHYVEHEIE